MTPHMLVVTADSLQATASIIAPAEGEMRFIAGSPAITTEARRGIPAALARLASQCGYTLSTETTSAAVVSGPPITMQIIGTPLAEDAAAIARAERFGIVRVAAGPIAPPRNPARHRTWSQPVLDQWQNGRSAALLVVLPPGALPQWAAQLFTALGDVELSPGASCVVLASDADLSAALPIAAALIPRGAHLATRLAVTLNRLRAPSALPGLPMDTPLFTHGEAISAALRATSAQHEKPCIYIEVADGTTIIVADGDETAIYHDPDHDYARGALRLVRGHDRADVARRIPVAPDKDFLRRWAMRRVSWPMAFLTDPADRGIAAALARLCLVQVMERIIPRLPDDAVWIVGPALTRLGSPAAALAVVADLMDTAHVAVVACDGDDLLPAVGALMHVYPAITYDRLLHDAVVPVGSVARVSLATARGRASTAVSVTDEKGRTYRVAVAGNALTAIADQGAVTLRFTDRTLPDDPISVEGGAGGILIDTRRRPLTAAISDPARPNVSNRLRPAAIDSGAGEQQRSFSRVP